ncbi:hypothetical protein [Thermoplasma volcanium GSS1]|uniref:DNA-directed DNA polymerase n=1 Tax=Thermoplasma volcanium (strain ATCC 51530 / DSM 4299 / JCM 9571 / NBRC 15438 / GSS1) TaxID=273116 RepID=Q979T6_THEVO|nr:type B DNA-directed DNA polymerase [Thermoplasma volcanium]BAB60216.1 hypothetical protein [Thermoplasma volcanium GSS1]
MYEYTGNNKIKKKRYRNSTWIFVSGDRYDLDNLARDLDQSSLRYEWAEMPDVYGYILGLKIYTRPSSAYRLGNLIYAKLGYGRRFRVYNADIDPVLRFMASNGLEFFQLRTFYDEDPDLNVIYVSCTSSSCKVNGKAVNDQALEDMLFDSHVVVYDGPEYFYRKLSMIGVPARYYPGRSFTSYGQIYFRDAYIDIQDRIAIPASSFLYSESGLSGIFEVSRVSYLNPVSVSIVTPGTAVSSMEVALAVNRGLLVPMKKDDHEGQKSPEELIKRDRGGLVFQPVPGIYRDVYEIDFSSMYPSIIVKYNLSPGNVKFLPEALNGLLERRLFYKRISASSEVYSNRNAALKWLLLTSFGYTGYKNAKFGKIEVHEDITEIGRKLLADAISIAHDHGFEMIHGIVDSLWISGNGDIEEVIREIRERTMVDIVVSGHYRWIVFLPENDGSGSPSRYYGLDYNGSYKVRGIELRRADAPEICKRFQVEALEVLRECRTVEDVMSSKAKIEALEHRYIKNIRRFPLNYFTISKKITRHSSEYSVNTVTRSALKAAETFGKVSLGQIIKYTVSDESRKIVNLDDDGTIDYRYYERCLRRAFQPFDFIFSTNFMPSRLEDFLSFQLER